MTARASASDTITVTHWQPEAALPVTITGMVAVTASAGTVAAAVRLGVAASVTGVHLKYGDQMATR